MIEIKQAFTRLARSKAYPIVCIGVGVGIGALTGTAVELVTRHLKERKYEEALDEYYPIPEIPEGVNVVEEDSYSETNSDGDVKKVNNELFSKPLPDDFLNRKRDVEKMVDYTKYSSPEKNRNDSEMPKDGEEPAPGKDAFEMIDSDEFVKAMGNQDGYACCTGTYFADDRILAGWNEKLEEKDASKTIGEDAVKALQEGMSSVYVRNTQLKVLFEVIRSDSSFAEAVEDSNWAKAEGVEETLE